MIARTWAGRILTSGVAAYTECAERARVLRTRAAIGNLGAWVLVRDLDDGYTEVLVISHWASLTALERWAGYDIEMAEIFTEERHFFVDHAPTAKHYTLATGAPIPGDLFA